MRRCVRCSCIELLVASFRLGLTGFLRPTTGGCQKVFVGSRLVETRAFATRRRAHGVMSAPHTLITAELGTCARRKLSPNTATGLGQIRPALPISRRHWSETGREISKLRGCDVVAVRVEDVAIRPA